MASLASAVCATALAAAPASAQEGYGSPLVVSETARKQLDAAQAEVMAKYGTPEKAKAAGWRRPTSSTPTMGEHWGNPKLRADKEMDPLKPEVLMFAPVNGELKLVGASWTMTLPKGEPVPKLFDGLDSMWHRHDPTDPLNKALTELADAEGGGRRGDAPGYVMNHLWFIPAQDGEFTGHNHWMPFMDAGLPTPPTSIKGEVLGQAALALAEVNNSAFIIARGYDPLPPAGKKEVDDLRSQIKALIPDYKAAMASKDNTAIIAVLGEMGALWTDIRAIQTRDLKPELARLQDVAYGNMIAGHDHGPGGHH